MGEEEDMPKKEVDNKKYYDLIGVPQSATEQEIKKAFRKKALKEHPDKGGDVEKFKELTVAYEVLSNSEKRNIYDKYGEEGLRDGGGGPTVAGWDDLLGGLFGRGRAERETGPKKAKTVSHRVDITLAEAYNGKKTKFKTTRKRICATCSGKGVMKENAKKKCSTCKGRGKIAKTMQIGPGMISQTIAPCDACRGEGEIVNEKDKCKKCKGVGVMDDVKVIELTVDKGTPDGEVYIQHGEGDEYPGIQAGDVHFEIRIKPHREFKRVGADLKMEKEISLYEALTGYSFVLKHLDGREVLVHNEPGQVISPSEIKTVEELGMPFFKNPYRFGNLFISFKIIFPDSLQEKQMTELKKVLTSDLPQVDKSIKDKYTMKNYSKEHENLHSTGAKNGCKFSTNFSLCNGRQR
eukprot:TRINITY_DN2040_c0_g1_i1.p1 TRINITY_DN2040_c0_g1~~TRINITY_DN2040_c0_g1_i1.p1  ORF type:complete len:428 (-),score=90.70 TRINITY_DN2040_c0_g1_i1:125-1345(-)